MSANLAQCGKQFWKLTAPCAASLPSAIWLMLAIWGWLWFGPMWATAMRPDPGQVIDFYQDWGSVRNYYTGFPLYTSHSISIPWHLGLASNPVPSIEYNAHPPTFVLLILPLGRLTYADAVLAWNIVTLLAVAASLLIIARELKLPPKIIPPTLALLPLCHPLYGNFHLGQLTPIIGFLLVMIWALNRAGCLNQAGALIGIATAIKLFPAYLGLYYLAQVRIRPLVVALLLFLGLNLTAAIAFGSDTYLDYLRVVLPYQSKFRSFGYNISVAGFWSKLFDPLGERNIITPLWYCPMLALGGALVSDLFITLATFKICNRARTVAQRDIAFGLVVTAMLLVSPVTWDFSLPLLLVPLVVITRCSLKSEARWMLTPLILIVVILWMPQILLTKFALAGRSLAVAPWTFMLGAPSLKFYALLGTFALGLAASSVEKKQPYPLQKLQKSSKLHCANGNRTGSVSNTSID